MASVKVVDDLSFPDSMEGQWDLLQLGERVKEHVDEREGGHAGHL